ncbi:hypothetical protein [Streptomyces klenkii]
MIENQAFGEGRAAVEHAERGEPGDGPVHLSGGLHAVGPTAPARP